MFLEAATISSNHSPHLFQLTLVLCRIYGSGLGQRNLDIIPHSAIKQYLKGFDQIIVYQSYCEPGAYSAPFDNLWMTVRVHLAY